MAKKQLMDFEYITKWALLNGFEVSFRQDKLGVGQHDVKFYRARFTHIYDGRIKAIEISEPQLNELFNHIEYEMPKIVMDLKHIKLEEICLLPRKSKQA